MAATPKPVRKVIKKASETHRKKMSEGGEHHKQFGSPSKTQTKKTLVKHESRLKEHAKKHGQIAMPHHPNYNKSRAEKTKERSEAHAHMKRHGG